MPPDSQDPCACPTIDLLAPPQADLQTCARDDEATVPQVPCWKPSLHDVRVATGAPFPHNVDVPAHSTDAALDVPIRADQLLAFEPRDVLRIVRGTCRLVDPARMLFPASSSRTRQPHSVTYG